MPLRLDVRAPSLAVITTAGCGLPEHIGSTALKFRGRRSGARRGERVRYDALSAEDLATLRLFAASPCLFELARAVLRVADMPNTDDAGEQWYRVDASRVDALRRVVRELESQVRAPAGGCA